MRPHRQLQAGMPGWFVASTDSLSRNAFVKQYAVLHGEIKFFLVCADSDGLIQSISISICFHTRLFA